MKLLLVDPQGNCMGLNIGLAYIAATVRSHGHRVAILDLNNWRTRAPETRLREIVSRFDPDLVGFSVLTLSYENTSVLLSSIREYYKGPIVLGGAQVTVEKQALLLKEPNVDFLVIGEGERTVLALLDHIAGKRESSRIPGLIYRQGDRLVENPSVELIRDLDSLPFPDYQALGAKEIAVYPLLTSRGCPYHCIFCLAALISGRKWRARRVECLIEELRHARRTYKCKSFAIMDDNFTLNIRRAEEFCERLITENLGLPWECANGVRADRVNESLVRKMKEAGCFRVFLGVESLVPEVFVSVKKGEELEDIRLAVSLFKRYGIEVHSFHIIGLPNDTYERTMRSFEHSKELGVDRSIWQLLVPFPGTEVYEWMAKHGRQCTSYRQASSFQDVTFDTPEFPKQQREEAFARLSLVNRAYPVDGRISKLDNGLKLLSWVFKYDPWGALAHIARLGWKAMRFFTKGERGLRTRAKFDPELLYRDVGN